LISLFSKIIFFKKEMENKYMEFIRYDWDNSEEWKNYLENIFPPPPQSRILYYKKKFYKLKVDSNFDINYIPGNGHLNNNNNANLNQRNNQNNNQRNNQNPNKPGTINTILLINTKLDESSLLLAEMIAVEAKAVALRDLMVSSNYSNEIATGTGTDGIAIFANLDSENFTDNVSKHAKIGELIGKVVIDSIKEALAKLQWLTPSYQLNALVRLDRFQYNLDDFYNDYLPSHMKMDGEEDKREFIVSLIRISKNPELVSYVSLIIHLLDQYRYGLLSKKTVLKASNSILGNQLDKDEWISMKLLLDYIIKTQLE
jgi:hypothetical protein